MESSGVQFSWSSRQPIFWPSYELRVIYQYQLLGLARSESANSRCIAEMLMASQAMLPGIGSGKPQDRQRCCI